MSGVTRRHLLAGSAAAVGGAAASTVTGVLPASAEKAADATEPFGPVTIRPADGQYADVVRGTNQRWVGSPDYVRLVGNAEQVVSAVQEAVAAGKRIQVRSGGHCYEDFVYNAAVDVVIDMSAMTRVHYDPIYDAFAVEAGAELRAVYETLYKGWGVTIPGGSCYAVGAGGHLTGGGYGLWSRAHATTVDYVYAVEVVVVDAAGTANRIVATRESWDHHRELWWAHTGGGGGNFGVVTRFWLRDPRVPKGTDPTKVLPKPPREVFVHSTAWPWASITSDGFHRLLRNWGTWHEANSAPDSPYRALTGVLRPTHKSNGQISLLTVMDATVPGATQLLNDYLAAISAGVGVARQPQTAAAGEHPAMPQFATPTPLPWFLATDWLSGANPNLRFKNKSAYHRKGWTDAQIGAMYRHLTRDDYANADMLVQIDSYGCQVNRVAADATAQPHRDSVLKSQFQVYWTNPADDAVHLQFVRELYRDVFADTGGVPVPNAVTDGCYVNYPDVDVRSPQWNTSGVPWSTLYYKGSYPRLRQVKARYDPRNVFRHGLSIEP